MKTRGKLIVLPNEDDILQEVFEREVAQGESHTKYLQEFSDTYMLGLHFEELDYQKAPCDIAELGHIVIKTEESVSLVIFYLPERVTDRQYLYIYNHQMDFSRYTQVNGYSLERKDGISWEKIHDISGIMHEIAKKNLLPSIKNESKSVK